MVNAKILLQQKFGIQPVKFDYMSYADLFMNRYKMSFDDFVHMKLPLFVSLLKVISEETKQYNKIYGGKHAR